MSENRPMPQNRIPASRYLANKPTGLTSEYETAAYWQKVDDHYLALLHRAWPHDLRYDTIDRSHTSGSEASTLYRVYKGEVLLYETDTEIYAYDALERFIEDAEMEAQQTNWHYSYYRKG